MNWKPRTEQVRALLGNKFINMGHRGTRGLAPENTIVSFQIANRFTSYFELDTMLCGSGELVVIHDETVNRTTNGKGRVADLTLTEIQSLDAGAFFSEEFEGETIPTLQELFEKMPSDCIFDIEVKSEGEEKERIRLAETLVPLLKEWKIENRVFVSSFDSFLLGKVKEKNPSLLRGQLLDTVWKEEDWRISEPDLILPNHNSITGEWTAQLHKEGYLVIPYTANEEKDWIRLKEAGVDGIITDRPDLLLSFLEKTKSV